MILEFSDQVSFTANSVDKTRRHKVCLTVEEDDMCSFDPIGSLTGILPRYVNIRPPSGVALD